MKISELLKMLKVTSILIFFGLGGEVQAMGVILLFWLTVRIVLLNTFLLGLHNPHACISEVANSI